MILNLARDIYSLMLNNIFVFFNDTQKTKKNIVFLIHTTVVTFLLNLGHETFFSVFLNINKNEI